MIERDEIHRFCQAAALVKLFRRVHGRDSLDQAELQTFFNEGELVRPLDPYAVLTAEEIGEVVYRYRQWAMRRSWRT